MKLRTDKSSVLKVFRYENCPSVDSLGREVMPVNNDFYFISLSRLTCVLIAMSTSKSDRSWLSEAN